MDARRALEEHPEVVQEVLAEIRERGPLGSRDFDGASSGGMWNWKPAKQVLDALWDRGELVIGARRGFQRQYDLTERVIPRACPRRARAPATPTRCACSSCAPSGPRGALTESGIAEHYRPGRMAAVRPHVAALEAEGVLRRLAVGRRRGRRPGPRRPAAGRTVSPGATLLSPFDNLLWDRPFAERLFGFDHTMEIYKPAPQRIYGYYVLPLLRGDRIVGRLDLKSDRKAGVLRVLRPTSSRAFATRPPCATRWTARCAAWPRWPGWAQVASGVRSPR